MPQILFERTGYSCDVPSGGAIVDICDEHPGAGIPFSCRSANCGTCRVEVTEGAALCEPPGADEVGLLALFGNRPRHRLACQLRVRAGTGRVALRVTL